MTPDAAGGDGAQTGRPRCFGRFCGLVLRVETVFICLLLTSLIVFSATQIVLRAAFSTGWSWADHLNKYTVLWIALMGAGVATRERKHITIDIVSRLLPTRGKLMVFALTDLFSATVCGVIAFACLRFVRSEREFGDVAFLNVPIWVVQIILPLGFAIMALRFLTQCAGNVAGSIRGGEQ